MQITINKANSQTNFEGTIGAGSRPVYNSNYNAPLLMVNDNDFDFTYAPGTMLQYSPDQFRDNLTSVLAFYAYLILAMDYDSFALEGGTNWYTQAQTVVTNAQGLSSPPAGWSAADGKQSRYALIDNILSQTFRPLRRCYYEYHRIGLDNAFDDPASSRQAMSDALISLRNVHRIRPANYNLQTFFQAKKDEIVKMFGVAPDGERARFCRCSNSSIRATSPSTTKDSADAPPPRHPPLRAHRPHRMGCGTGMDRADRRDGSGKSILLGALGLVLGARAEAWKLGKRNASWRNSPQWVAPSWVRSMRAPPSSCVGASPPAAAPGPTSMTNRSSSTS